MKKILMVLIICLFFQFTSVEAYQPNEITYPIPTMKRSHWALNPVTGSVLYQNNKPYRDTGSGIYNFQRILDPSKTAIICMDCWRNMADPVLDAYFHDVAVNKIYPLMLDAANNGFTTVFVTNDPSKYTYNIGVDLSLAPLVVNNGAIVLYHDTYDNPTNPLAFYYWLSSRGIDTLIYVGFASTVCVMYRLEGMVFMQRYFSRIYFVPEASATVENIDNWDGHIHKNQTEIISKQFELIDFDELINVLP